MYRPGGGNEFPDFGLNFKMPDPFDMLGLTPTFDLSIQSIEAAYLARSVQFHPDLVGDENEAAQRSAELNDARAILVNPESRANALLVASGGLTKEQDRTLPDGFLLEILETREEIESELASDSPTQSALWNKWAALEQDRYNSRISELFRQSPLPLAEIRKVLNAWRYIERLIEQLDHSSAKSGAKSTGKEGGA